MLLAVLVRVLLRGGGREGVPGFVEQLISIFSPDFMGRRREVACFGRGFGTASRGLLGDFKSITCMCMRWTGIAFTACNRIGFDDRVLNDI